MPSEKKRAYLALALLAVFAAAFAVLFAGEGMDAFRPQDGDAPWISVLSAACVLALAVSALCYRGSLRPAALLGDEREQELALRAGLLAKTFVLALLFGLGIWLESAAGAEQAIELPRRAIGFALASLMAAYLGARAVAILCLYGRE